MNRHHKICKPSSGLSTDKALLNHIIFSPSQTGETVPLNNYDLFLTGPGWMCDCKGLARTPQPRLHPVQTQAVLIQQHEEPNIGTRQPTLLDGTPRLALVSWWKILGTWLSWNMPSVPSVGLPTLCCLESFSHCEERFPALHKLWSHWN